MPDTDHEPAEILQPILSLAVALGLPLVVVDGPVDEYRHRPVASSYTRSGRALASSTETCPRSGSRSPRLRPAALYSDDPSATARLFYDTLGRGGQVRRIERGYIRTFDDGTHITYRPVSRSDGSPAIQISVQNPRSPLARYQKIHFMEGSDK